MDPIRELIDAILSNDFHLVQELWSRNPNFLTGKKLWWPLHTAVSGGRDEIVDFLLENGCDPNANGHYGKDSALNGLVTPLHLAASMGQIDLLEKLLAWGADIHGNNQFYTPIQIAARHRRYEMVDVLLKRGARLDIFVAAALGMANRIKSFLEEDPVLLHVVDEFGTTSLHLAAEQWQLEALQVLLDRESDVNAKDKRKRGVLHYSVNSWRSDISVYRDIIDQLVSHGVDINAKDWHDITPLHRACRFANLGIVQALLENGADINARDKGGNTPLRRAVKNPQAFELVRLLLNQGADIHARDKKGLTIFQTARSKDMKEYLRKSGAIE